MSVYVSPECKVAGEDAWPEAHKLCCGPGATPAPGGGIPLQVLHCGCACHAVRSTPVPPPAIDTDH